MTAETTSVLAGEYVLGLLPPGEMRAVEARLASDPELRAEIERWQTDFGALLDVEETAPPARVGARLRARFGEAKPPRATWAPSNAAILVLKAGAVLALAALIWGLA